MNRNEFSTFQKKYKHSRGGSVPVSMFKYIYKALAQDVSKICNNELDERIINFCLSKDHPNWWTDMCPANNGVTKKYNFSFQKPEISEGISRSKAYRNEEKRYITADNLDLISIPRLYQT